MRMVFGFLLWALCTGVVAEVVIHAGRMVDVNTGEVLEAQTIVVEGDRIKEVSAGYQGTANVDLKDSFVMPGWIDMHVHITSQQGPNRFVERFTLEPADYALRAVAYAERTLIAGFTTVRGDPLTDIEAMGNVNFVMKGGEVFKD